MSQGGGNPFANMGNLMENIKKAQQMVQVEAGKVQEELARFGGAHAVWSAQRRAHGQGIYIRAGVGGRAVQVGAVRAVAASVEARRQHPFGRDPQQSRRRGRVCQACRHRAAAMDWLPA